MNFKFSVQCKLLWNSWNPPNPSVGVPGVLPHVGVWPENTIITGFDSYKPSHKNVENTSFNQCGSSKI